MLKKITKSNIQLIKNQAFSNYAQVFTDIEQNTMDSIQSFGLPFEQGQKSEQRKAKLKKLRAREAIVRNNDKSIYTNRISSACEACQTGTGSYTSFVSLKCHRDCYFCFNKNQEDYTFYSNHEKDANEELSYLINNGYKLEHLALTGGEPLLHKDETVSFFKLTQKISPHTFTRLYTAGDLLTEEVLEQLQAAGLDEIRISIKMEDPLKRRKRVLNKVELAQKYIPQVLIEMPVIPGTLKGMKQLLLDLDNLGIFGINLLEFCFPLVNSRSFTEEGFTLKNPPYDVYYNYWYAGGLAVADSEDLCLDLLEFALDEQLELGVHYCSLENKFTGQIYQQNHDQVMDHTYHFSSRDYFYKTVKAFGSDIEVIQARLEEIGIPYTLDEAHNFIQFPIPAIKLLKLQNTELAIVSSVVDKRMDENVIQEVSLDWTTCSLFTEADID